MGSPALTLSTRSDGSGQSGVAWAFLGQFVATALAASPAPSAAGGDPRSSGQGPGLVGEPLLAVGLVLAIGLAATVATLGYVRLTGRRRW